MTANPYEDDSKVLVIAGTVGRDHGKNFRVNEANPIVMAGFMLRLLAALRLSQQDDLMGFLRPDPDDEGEHDLNKILRLLTGCEPVALTALIHDALAFVEVAPDPAHPTAFRALHDNDIREMKTLGTIIGAFARVNLLSG